MAKGNRKGSIFDSTLYIIIWQVKARWETGYNEYKYAMQRNLI